MVVTSAAVDVEAHTVSWLRGALPAGVTVATAVPRTRTGELAFPERMVRVSRTGGVMLSPAHDRATILVECWAASGPKAWALAGAARAAMLALDNTLTEVAYVGEPRPVGAWLSHRSEGSGPVNLEDPQTTMPRYQMLHEVLVRAAHGPS